MSFFDSIAGDHEKKLKNRKLQAALIEFSLLRSSFLAFSADLVSSWAPGCYHGAHGGCTLANSPNTKSLRRGFAPGTAQGLHF